MITNIAIDLAPNGGWLVTDTSENPSTYDGILASVSTTTDLLTWLSKELGPEANTDPLRVSPPCPADKAGGVAPLASPAAHSEAEYVRCLKEGDA